LKTAFSTFLEEESPSARYQPVSEALFSYNKMINLCIHSIKEDSIEGKTYFKDFMVFMTDEYREITDKFTENPKFTNKNLDLTKSEFSLLLRGYELRKFIRENLIYDLFSTMFTYMNKEISEVKIFLDFQGNFDFLKIPIAFFLNF